MNTISRFTVSLLLWFGVSTSVYAQNLSDETIMMQRAQELGAFVKANNAQGVVDYSDDSIKALVGAETYTAITKMSMDSIKESGVVFEALIFGAPTSEMVGNNRVFRFIPKTTIMSARGKKSNIKGFLFAVKNQDGIWKFVEGSGLLKHPALVKKLYPDLPSGIEFPDVSTQ